MQLQSELVWLWSTCNKRCASCNTVLFLQQAMWYMQHCDLLATSDVFHIINLLQVDHCVSWSKSYVTSRSQCCMEHTACCIDGLDYDQVILKLSNYKCLIYELVFYCSLLGFPCSNVNIFLNFQKYIIIWRK